MKGKLQFLKFIVLCSINQLSEYLIEIWNMQYFSLMNLYNQCTIVNSYQSTMLSIISANLETLHRNEVDII